MLPLLVLMSIFFIGFTVGYGARAWRSHRRHERFRLHAAYRSSNFQPTGEPHLRVRRSF